MVFAVGRFVVTHLPDAACEVRCVPQSLWTAPEDSGFAAAGPFRRVGEIVDFYSRLVGPFPYPDLAHVEALTPFGGMENATAIFYNDSLYRAQALPERTVAHEVAHQWFGDAVTEDDWHHLWLSEGFAEYLSAMWAEHTGGAAALAAEMRQKADRYLASPMVERPVIDPAVRQLDSLLNANNYQKGAWVLHQLRGLIGDSAFVAGLRAYYRGYKDSTAVSADFARAMGVAAGSDLDWYFRQALTQPGYPVLDVRWRHGGGKLTLEIRQTQKAEWGTYRLPGLELAIDGKVVRVDVAGRDTRVVLDGFRAAPRSVIVDPAGWWLLRSTVARAQ
jgi:aminopeptidase N